jgi:TRAP-type C4-dicarboxylate transport system permease small subunit
MMARLWLGFIKVQATVVVTLILFVVCMTLANTLLRASGQGSITWAEELSRMLFVIFSFTAAALACSFGAHLVVDGIVDKSHGWLRKIFGVFQVVLTGLFFVALIWGGLVAAIANETQTSPAIGFPIAVLYLAVAISGVLMVLNSVFAYRYGTVAVHEGRIQLTPPSSPLGSVIE